MWVGEEIKSIEIHKYELGIKIELFIDKIDWLPSLCDFYFKGIGESNMRVITFKNKDAIIYKKINNRYLLVYQNDLSCELVSLEEIKHADSMDSTK